MLLPDCRRQIYVYGYINNGLNSEILCRYGSFLSEDECDHLIKMAKPHMKDATVIDKKIGEKIPNRWCNMCILPATPTLSATLEHIFGMLGQTVCGAI